MLGIQNWFIVCMQKILQTVVKEKYQPVSAMAELPYKKPWSKMLALRSLSPNVAELSIWLNMHQELFVTVDIPYTM